MTEENCRHAPLSIDDWLTSWENEGKRIGAPMVFFSYAYASPEHCQWVQRLSDKLRNDGVNTVIDKYVPSGYDLAQFMEKGIRWPGVKYIVCVCSSLYTQKATNGTGGVGYEKMIVTRELVKQTNTNKFIPILRDNPEGETPDFLGTRFYCDFREDVNFETMYQQLLQDLLGRPKAPPLGGGAKKTQMLAQKNEVEATARSVAVNVDDPLGYNEESFRMAKKLLLETRKRGVAFFTLLLPEVSARYFFDEQGEKQFFYCEANQGSLALHRLEKAGFIEIDKCCPDNLRAILQRLIPPVPIYLIKKYASSTCTITLEGLDYCEKHRDDLATEPAEK